MGVDLLLGLSAAAGIMAHRATGFGFALVSVPLFALLVGAEQGVALCNVLFVPVCLAVLAGTWRGLRWELLWPFVPPAMVGAILGVVATRLVSDAALLVLSGAVVIVLVVRMLTSRGTPSAPVDDAAILPTRLPAAVSTGLLSGVLQGATATGGPPMAIHAQRHGWPNLVAVPTMQCLNVLMGTVAVGARGLSPGVDVTALIVVAGFLVVGAVAGELVARRLPATVLLRGSAGLAIAGGLSAVVKGVLAL